jgi:hypothetical protein
MHGTIAVALTLLLTLCIQQCKKPVIEEVQPELSEEGFIDLVNTILVEKVSLDMFEMDEGGSYTYIRNTYNDNGKEVHVWIHRYVTEIHIAIDHGHFTRTPHYSPPEIINVKGLLTPQIGNQVDLTPPPDIGKCRTYDIVIMTYEGTLEVCMSGVTIYFRNIGAYTPRPTHPDPTGNTIYYIVAGILILILAPVVFVVIKLRRKKS